MDIGAVFDIFQKGRKGETRGRGDLSQKGPAMRPCHAFYRSTSPGEAQDGEIGKGDRLDGLGRKPEFQGRMNWKAGPFPDPFQQKGIVDSSSPHDDPGRRSRKETDGRLDSRGRQLGKSCKKIVLIFFGIDAQKSAVPEDPFKALFPPFFTTCRFWRGESEKRIGPQLFKKWYDHRSGFGALSSQIAGILAMGQTQGRQVEKHVPWPGIEGHDGEI